jgi:hypothetical protein
MGIRRVGRKNYLSKWKSSVTIRVEVKMMADMKNDLKSKVEQLYQAIDTIEPEEVDLDEIDRILEMVTDLEETCKQLKNS